MMRGLASAYLETELFGTNADEVVLCCAILVGQVEQRPMTAGKLANYAGMPRPTVVRKLKSLESRGMVVMVDGAATLPIERLNAMSPQFVRHLLNGHVQKVASELSKLDR